MSRFTPVCAVLFFCLGLLASLPAQDLASESELGRPAARLLRFPHVMGERMVFCHGGDIWTVATAGGEAQRLTSFDVGLELFPRISPDGRLVAFSGEYEGSRQLFVVPYEGGEPRQLTFYPDVGVMPPRGGYDNLVYDWTPDGSKILLRSNRTPYGQRVGKYFLVDPKGGGMETALSVPEGGAASFSPDGKKLAYNIISREWRTWKRYRAGRAQDVYIYDLESNEVERITDFAGTDNSPLWLGERIYFCSDRNGTLNLHAYDLATKTTRAVTKFDDFDVLFPSRGKGGITFERGGRLWLMEEGSERVREVVVTLADDRPSKRRQWKSGAGRSGGFDLSPSATRVVFEFRGEIFDAPKKDGLATNLTESPAIRERQPRWSPDGRWITWLAEVGDHYELMLHDRRNRKSRALTKNRDAWILTTEWAPDSKKIAVTDKKNRLWTVAVPSGEITPLDRGEESGIGALSWSADSRWLTYTKIGQNRLRSVWVCPADRAAARRVTSERWSDGSPSFDPEGRWLWFVSARNFRYRDLSFDDRIYGILLNDDSPEAFAYREDAEKMGLEENPEPEDEKNSEASEANQESEFEIDFEGIENRVFLLPVSAGNYSSLLAQEKGLIYRDGGDLKRFDFEDRKAAEVLAGVFSFRSDAKRKHLAYRHRGKIALAKAKAGQKAGRGALDLSALRLQVDPRVEWSQMYQDAWRIMRDFFYDPKMHRVDWTAMRDKYRPLLDHMSHRSDLDFLLGELVGELNAGHTYVTRGDEAQTERVAAGVLGAEFEADRGRYRIAKIYRGENWDPAGRSPLGDPSKGVSVGDYLLAIEGRELRADEHLYRRLVGTVGQRIRLTVGPRPVMEDVREVVVRPVASETRLRYLDWVERNQELVRKLSKGRIGYIHVPNTAVEGHRRLFEGFRAQARQVDALIVDDRYNGGGFIPDRMAQALGGRVMNYWSTRDAELYSTPRFGFNGPLAMLINGYSSSGGDAFPYYFRKLGLGPLIGRTTWGGLVGYTGSPRLLDGGGLAVPSFAFVNDDGEWDVEAVGVSPDQEVFDDPALIRAGREPMIEAAVKHLLDELQKSEKVRRPTTPDGPDRRR